MLAKLSSLWEDQRLQPRRKLTALETSSYVCALPKGHNQRRPTAFGSITPNISGPDQGTQTPRPITYRPRMYANEDNAALLTDGHRNFLYFGNSFMPEAVLKTEGTYFDQLWQEDRLEFWSNVLPDWSGHLEVVETIHAHAAGLDHLYSGMVSPPVIKLAKTLIDVLPDGLGKALFLSTGGENNECAIRLAKTFTGKFETVGLGASWHGVTSGDDGAQYHAGRKGFGPVMSGMFMLPSQIARNADGSFDWESELNYGWSLINKVSCASLAVVILEPIFPSGGMIAIPLRYMKAMKTYCEK
ncbi:hypothetical protein B7494_g7490 [Chlorociboria aeruginascens]|nr:hypothetical protein B7494_g7490 [Chlorociboria aeruginascens]